MVRFPVAPLLASLLLTGQNAFGSEPTATADQIRFFETSIRPVLAEHCYRCHGPKKQRAGLRLDSHARILKGGSSGAVVEVGNPQRSLLLQAVRHEDPSLKMPPDDKLADRQIADLARWVRMGLPYPPERTTAAKKKDTFWAFKAPVDPPVPAVKDAGWPRSPLDHFILARLEENGLQPAPPADRRTLIRRVTFDLIGLPPTPQEADDFSRDESPDAFAKVVDRLLDSPHYGERWARHWLDVARYADSNGLDENVAYGNAWRYRDYVVAAFNNDKPYDQFLLEQLAGDLLPARDAAARSEQLIATGFLALGPKVLAEVDEKKMELDIIDEQIDTVGRTVLGLTLGCARCHDHKFDPITTEDYHGLAGIFQSTKTMEHFKKIARWHENPLDPDLYPKQVADAKKGPEPQTALGVTEGKIVETPIFIRGNHLKPGKLVPRAVPDILAGMSSPTFEPKTSGRLELARWLFRPDHPLTARVLVNRLWRWHFGSGIVPTPDNFGLLGEPPVNPPLLDWLTCRFVEDHWSLKAMHRRILLSSTYQMSSAADAKAVAIDPENRWQWRANVRRLEAEAIRDNLLAVSGLLDKSVGGSMLHVKNREFLFDHTSKDTTKYDSRRRSLYLPVIRNNVYDVFQLFDFPDPAVSTGDRATTTVAPQALFLLNSDWVGELCEQMAIGLLKDGDTDAARVHQLYLRAYSRLATAREVHRALDLVSAVEAALGGDMGAERCRDLAWASLCQTVLAANEFIYVQ